MILNKSQAQAVYDAMCALNNVSGKIESYFENIYVMESVTGFIYINDITDSVDEVYSSQSEFAEAYQLN